jgi:uncharacterized protein YqjF (DUF2071 family)
MPWAVAMDWRDALFLHWRADAAMLRSVIPRDLELDTYSGSAWVSIVAFRITGARLRGMPPFAALPPFNEINVRTYVRDREKGGVWFFSLDAANPFAVWAGQTGLHLPYIDARIDGSWQADRCTYHSERTRGSKAARFSAEVSFGDTARPAAAGSLGHWLAERYCFFTSDRRGRTLRGDVAHEPWPLYDATGTISENGLLSAAGIVALDAEPIAHASPGVSTHAWPLRRAAVSSYTMLRQAQHRECKPPSILRQAQDDTPFRSRRRRHSKRPRIPRAMTSCCISEVPS